MDHNEISGQIVDAAMKVHSAFGPGLLESAYHACLAYELRKRQLRCRITSGSADPTIDGVKLDAGYGSICWSRRCVIVESRRWRRFCRSTNRSCCATCG